MRKARSKGADRPAAKNIEAIATLEREAVHDRSRLDRITDGITAMAGSFTFIVVHAVWFFTWITANLLRKSSFDPYPFSLLTLAVSLEAIFLTGFVLMTQNRMTRQADKRAHLDLQVNLLAEQELTAMLQMLYALCRRSGVAVTLRDGQIKELLKDTDIHQISVALDRNLVKTEA
jgi:uncharacterized membrane protein